MKKGEIMKKLKIEYKQSVFFFVLFFISLDAKNKFESFNYQEAPIQVGTGFASVEASDFLPQATTQFSDSFIVQKYEEPSRTFSTHEFEDVALEESGVDILSPNFESSGQIAGKRLLTDQQKVAEQISEERSIEEKRKQDIWWKLQEAKDFEKRRTLWKSYEKEVDVFSEKKSSQVSKPKDAYSQQLFQKLQELQARASEKEAMANNLANQLAKLSVQRNITAQQIQVQKAAMKKNDQQNVKEKSSVQKNIAQSNKDIQDRAVLLMHLNNKYNDIDRQLQNARKQAQDARREVDGMQRAFEVQQTPPLQEEY